MFEDTNQTADVSEGESLFDDFEETAEDTNEAAGAEETNEEQEADVEEPAADAAPDAPEEFTVIHLGKEVKLSRDDLLKAAQKGMDYDHVREERDKLKGAKEFAIVDQMAASSGMTREQYVERIKEMEEAERQRTIAEQLKASHPEADDGTLLEMAKLKTENERRAEAERRGQEEKREREERVRATHEKRQRDMNDFIEAYPDIKDFENEIPKEVWGRVRAGESLLSAYRAHENAQLRAKIAAFEQNQKNKEKSIGSVNGAGTNSVADDFLTGFLG